MGPVDLESLLCGIVDQMMKKKNIQDYEVYIDGRTGNADGYMGDIVFFHVILDKNQRLNFVLKAAKTQEKLKTLLGADIMCARELSMYNTVLPALEYFTKNKKYTELSRMIPRTWYGHDNFGQVNIVLENLKLQNFHIRDRRKPMDFPHMSVLFETFGRWHGISMAFKDQHPEKLSKLVGNWPDPRAKFMKTFGHVKQFKKEFNIIRKMLVERGRTDLVNIYEGVEDQIHEALFRENVDQRDLMIISHGDNWSTNYMFKYKESNENSTPIQAVFIDFQLSRMDSPAFELSSTLYNMGDKQTLEKFNDLLSIYHKSLSRTLKILGSNPEELFTMDDLKRHWKEYGLAGVLNVFVYLRIALCDPDDAPDLGRMAENGEDFDEAFGFQMQHMDTFWERALDVFIHYGEFLQRISITESQNKN